MVNKYILDTNILIGLYRSRNNAEMFLKSIGKAVMVTSIFNHIAFLAGASMHTKPGAGKFLKGTLL
jgi:predicted nucleic acid-binding protein